MSTEFDPTQDDAVTGENQVIEQEVSAVDVAQAPEGARPETVESAQAQVQTESSVDPSSPWLVRRLDRTTLTAIVTFWLAFLCLAASLVLPLFMEAQRVETWHFWLTIAYYVLWVVAAISSAASLLFARFREKVASFLLLTIVAVDLTFMLLPMSTDGYDWVYKLIHLIVDVNLLVAATYIATRKPRPKK